MKKEKTKVVFRIWPDGDVTALFPQIPDSYDGYMCMSYEHIGQHGGADTTVVVNRTRPAKWKEYGELAKELRQIGYSLVVGRRCTARDQEIRKQIAKKFALKRIKNVGN